MGCRIAGFYCKYLHVNRNEHLIFLFTPSGDITEKGYQKKKAKILEQFHVHYYESRLLY